MIYLATAATLVGVQGARTTRTEKRGCQAAGRHSTNSTPESWPAAVSHTGNLLPRSHTVQLGPSTRTASWQYPGTHIAGSRVTNGTTWGLLSPRNATIAASRGLPQTSGFSSARTKTHAHAHPTCERPEHGNHNGQHATAAVCVGLKSNCRGSVRSGEAWRGVRTATPRWWVPNRFLQNRWARFSLPSFNTSIARFSYGAKPITSRTMSRTNCTRFGIAFCTSKSGRPQR